MKKTFLCFSLLMFIICKNVAQDVITKNDGTKLLCVVTREDSFKVFIVMTVKEKPVSTFINRSDILSIKYQNKEGQNAVMENNLQKFEPIHSESGTYFLGYGHYIDGPTVGYMLRKNPIAYNEYLSAKTSKNFANLMAYAGGLAMGYSFGRALSTGILDLRIFGGGGLLAILSVLVANGSEYKMRSAINIYNKDAKSTSLLKEEIRIGLASQGLGICISF